MVPKIRKISRASTRAPIRVKTSTKRTTRRRRTSMSRRILTTTATRMKTMTRKDRPPRKRTSLEPLLKAS